MPKIEALVSELARSPRSRTSALPRRRRSGSEA